MNKINLITYQKAKNEIDKLQEYISLIENYEVNNLDQFIIKNYAITNSSSEVIKLYNCTYANQDMPLLSREYIINLIKGPPLDDLHKIIRYSYKKKYRVVSKH